VPNLFIRDQKNAGVWNIPSIGLILVSFLCFFPHLFHIQEYIFFGLLVLTIGFSLYKGQAIWVRTPIDLPLLLFVGWVLFTVPFAIDPAYSFEEWRKLVAQVLVFYWALMVLEYSNIRNLHLLVFLAAIIGSCTVNTYGVLGYITDSGFIPLQGGKRGGAYAPGPTSSTWLATYGVMTLPLALACFSMTNLAWKQFAYLLGLLTMVLGLIYAGSRAAWLAVLVQVMILVWAYRSNKMRALMAFSLVIAVLMTASISETLPDILERVWERWGFWQYGVEAVLNNPITGIGYGNDSINFYAEKNGMAFDGGNLHNTILTFLVGAGFPVIIFFVWWVGRLFKVLAFFSKEEDKTTNFLTVNKAVALIVVGFMIRNMFEYHFAGSLAYLFWILIAMGVWTSLNKISIDETR